MRALALTVMLAACAAPQAQPSYQISLSSSGIEVIGTGQEIGFGRTAPSAIAALTKVQGSDYRRVDQAGCFVLIWEDALGAHFTPDFSGWRLGDQSAGQLC